MAKGRAQLLSVALLLLFWQAIAWLRLWPPYLFPVPLDVAATLWRLTASDELAVAILHTVKRIGLGFIVSAAAAARASSAATSSACLASIAVCAWASFWLTCSAASLMR